MMRFKETLQQYEDAGIVPTHYRHLLEAFWDSYREAIAGVDIDPGFQEELFLTLLSLLKKQSEEPFVFEPFHKQVRTPFDYYEFGLKFTRPLVDKDESALIGEANVNKIENFLAKKENVILFANHQTELDPQIIGCLLEDHHANLASNMIFVAGQKVITDFLAIPFSMGCNLLCIYSKRHIDHDPSLKQQKQLHNQKTMKLMSDLLKEGGKCIYVAPSGGRDRPNQEGIVEVDPFDPNSIEMFRLMAMQSKKPTHFIPLALSTYNVLPPPSTIEKDVGEKRSTQRSKVHICFGNECDMNLASDSTNRQERREILAKAIWSQVNSDYLKMSG